MAHTQISRHVRLFRNGRNQAVRIPREFELPGDEAVLRREKSGCLVLEPMRAKTLLQLLDSWTPLDEKDQLPETADRPPADVDLG